MLYLQAPATETELLKHQTDSATLSHAQHLLEEQKDDVKHMNQMVQYAKCVTLRDQQIQEKKAAMLADEAEQRRLDMEMEIERLRALEAYQVREEPCLQCTVMCGVDAVAVALAVAVTAIKLSFVWL